MNRAMGSSPRLKSARTAALKPFRGAEGRLVKMNCGWYNLFLWYRNRSHATIRLAENRTRSHTVVSGGADSRRCDREGTLEETDRRERRAASASVAWWPVVEVAVALYVTNSVAIDETKETFEISGYLTAKWKDPIRFTSRCSRSKEVNLSIR